MSNESIESIRTKLAAEREEKFRTKFAVLLKEAEASKEADEFFINEMFIPANGWA
jgi:hypothetical protein